MRGVWTPTVGTSAQAYAAAILLMFDQVVCLQQLPRQLCQLNLTCTLISTTQKGTNLLFHPYSSMHAKELYTVHTRSKP